MLHAHAAFLKSKQLRGGFGAVCPRVSEWVTHFFPQKGQKDPRPNLGPTCTGEDAVEGGRSPSGTNQVFFILFDIMQEKNPKILEFVSNFVT